jgi:hypothetical protein
MPETILEQLKRWLSDDKMWIGGFENVNLEIGKAGQRILVPFDDSQWDDGIIGQTQAPDSITRRYGLGAGWQFRLALKTRDVYEAYAWQFRSRYVVIDACNGFYLLDTETGEEACMGDGVDQEFYIPDYGAFSLETHTQEEFRKAWEEDANQNPEEYYEAYFNGPLDTTIDRGEELYYDAMGFEEEH